MIKISVRDITSAGMDLKKSFPKESIGLSDEEIDLRSNVEVNAHIERAGNTISADTKVTADLGSMCARCLEDIHTVQEFDYQFEFEVTPSTEYIDLGEEIRQEMIMAVPSRVLCKDDCKGICACGVNLNTEKCTCPNK